MSALPRREPGAVPVLEIGGTHVVAALVDLSSPEPRTVHSARTELDSAAGADEILGALGDAGHRLNAGPGVPWGIAMPGPFDYERGIGLFSEVGKFDHLRHVDIGARLAPALGTDRRSLRFINDASAYGIGEWAFGAAAGASRALCLTLGTGIGSAFLDEGRVVDSGDEVPAQGYAYRVTWEGRPLEEWVSRRAILRRWMHASGSRHSRTDVRDIVDAARRDDPIAAGVINEAFTTLGQALAPWIARFGAQVVVIGGSMAASLDVLEPPVRRGLARGNSALGALAIRPAAHLHDAPLFGAAVHATRSH